MDSSSILHPPSSIFHLPSFHAVACALQMQQAMAPFAAVETPAGETVEIAIKIIITAGPVRRFLVGDPHIQYLDVLAGQTLDRLDRIKPLAQKGEILVGQEIVAQLGDAVQVAMWRPEVEAKAKVEASRQCAVVTGLTGQVEADPSPISNLQYPMGTMSPISNPLCRPWLLPPVYERLSSGQGQFLAEIRPAVALFVKFGGLDYDHDDDAGVKLDAYIRWAQSIVALYEGSLIQLTIGDKGSYFYAAFGAPLTHDDDAARAVAAAFDLRSPPGLEFISGVQIGLSQGQMRIGAYGSSIRCTYGVLGDEVNIAARLMNLAEAGQILVSQHIARAAGEHYNFKYLEPIPVKGRTDPVPVFVALGRREARVEPLAGDAGVGKSRLAAALVEQAHRAGLRVVQAGCQSVAQTIAYDPWRQIFQTLFELTGKLSENTDPAARTAQQISRVEARLRQIKPDWLLRLPLLGDLLGLPVADNPTTAAFSPQLRREALLALAIEIIQHEIQAQPLLLLIEDVHWMDEASLALTSALARVMAEQPILLALVHRPPQHPLLPDLNSLTYHHHLRLSELSPPEIALLVTHRLQISASASGSASISPLALALIQLQAQGNPFFTEELLNALRETRHLQRPDDGGDGTLSRIMFDRLRRANCLTFEPHSGQWTLRPDAPLASAGLGLPDSIHGAILTRLDRLPPAYKLTLKVASVIGPSFDFELLAQTHPAQPGPDALREQLALLQERDFIRQAQPSPPLTYGFKHHLTQEVAYKNLLNEQQRRLHHRAGETLERLRPEAVEALAYHYSHSEAREKTLFYLDKAARKAQREYANETALNYYNQALALEERWEWRRGQVEVLHILGQREVEENSLQALAANPAAPTFDVTYLWGQYHEVIGNYAEAQAAVEKALTTSRELDDLTAEVRCLAQLGMIAYRQGDYDRAKTWYKQALVLFRSEETYPDEAMRAFTQAFDGLSIVHYEQGEYEQAQSYYKQALILSRVSGDRPGEANTLLGMGTTASYRRSFAEAHTYFQQALTIQRTIGDRAGEGTTLFNLAQALIDTGNYSQVQKYLTEALTILQATGNRWQQVYVWNSMGIIYLTLGDLSRAQSCLEQGLQLAQEIGAEESRSYILVNLGLALQLQGNLTSAEQVLVDGLALAQTIDNKRLVSAFLSYLSAVYLQAGRLEQAVERASVALTLRNELGLRLQTTYDLTTLAAAHLAQGEVTKAVDYAGQVLAILEECGGEGPELPERDYWVSCQVLMAAGQTDRARATLQVAYHLVMARAEKITDSALRQSFLERLAGNREIVAEYKKHGSSDPKGL
ncbi:MAG: tetratricopeptide repeat protein [Chloroflexi bacterium]|nr:tetratricopeptide repeat protein [Chloroflexota bacterium]